MVVSSFVAAHPSTGERIIGEADDIASEQLRARFEAALEHHEPEFERFFLFRFFGLSVTYGPETCRVDIPAETLMFNPQGSLHGGVIALAMDVSMGHLLENENKQGVTLDLHTSFVRAVRGPAYARSRFLKVGRRVAHVASELFDDQDRLCASSTATFLRVPPPGAEANDA